MKLLPLTALCLVGCAGHPPLAAPKLTEWVEAPAEVILNSAAAEFQALDYHVYLGNTGMVVASKTESTFWSGPAFVAGLAVLPAFFITWPVVSLLDHSERREFTMWWPARAFTWVLATKKETVIYVSAEANERGGSWVTVEVISPDQSAQRHAQRVIESLRTIGKTPEIQP